MEEQLRLLKEDNTTYRKAIEDLKNRYEKERISLTGEVRELTKIVKDIKEDQVRDKERHREIVEERDVFHQQEMATIVELSKYLSLFYKLGFHPISRFYNSLL